MASSPTRLTVHPLHIVRCVSRKVAYLNYRDAFEVAEAMMTNGAVLPGCHITPYECPECHWFHVGNRRIVFKDEEDVPI